MLLPSKLLQLLLLRAPFSFLLYISRYNLLNYLKAEFVLNASIINPFNSSHFFWIDGGYGHGLPNIWPPHKGKRWPDTDKVCCPPSIL